jgi:hypothetical protein
MAQQPQPIRRRARFVEHGVSSAGMQRIADATAASVKGRIQRGLNVYDSPAAPLATTGKRNKRYAYFKAGYKRKRGLPTRGGGEIRDWTLTGHTLQQLKTIRATVNRAVIGFLDAVAPGRRIAAGVIAYILNRKDRQFGLSPSDQRVMSEAVKSELRGVVTTERVA